MAATVGMGSTPPVDPQYKAAVNAFQMGEWAQAIQLLGELRHRYPDDLRVAKMLESAQFKAGYEANTKIREKRWIVPWRAIILRVLMIGTVISLLFLGFGIIRLRVLPMVATIQAERHLSSLLTQAQGLLASGDWDAAEAKFDELLQSEPGHPEALAGKEQVQKERELFTRYSEAVKAASAGDDAAAMTLFSKLQMDAPDYRDVGARILALRRQKELGKLYDQVGTLRALGLEEEAITALLQLKALDVNYRRAEVDDLLYALNLKQGQRIVNQNPADPSQISLALDYFNSALQQRPNDATALTEARLAVNFIAGRDAYNDDHWLEAVNRLRTIRNDRPDYLSGAADPMLYVALIHQGDAYMESDLLGAYEQYRQACELPVPDAVAACVKANSAILLLTPTPTPTMTPTPGPTALPPTITPTPTPRSLMVFRNRIVFKSDNPDQPGYYAMDPDGANREFLGPYEYYDEEFAKYRETERYSPDESYWVSTSKVDGRPQVIMHFPVDPRFGEIAPRPVTRLTGMAYDPVWSPDGAWIAFVAQENESDDIWISRPDNSEQISLVRNQWEWDKHPSWSPDSKRIVFFSNRTGTTQIWVMDANGQNPKNISNVQWPESDPVWVK